MILLNAFSLNMIKDYPCGFAVHEITAEEARGILLCSADDEGELDAISSAVGHADTAAVFSSVLGIPVPCHRLTVSIEPGEQVIVGQYSGPRLEEGTTKLPEGASIKWLLVEIDE